MKLEQQVCSLELSKRLKKLGVKQESIFHWVEVMNVDFMENTGSHFELRQNYGVGRDSFAAFTVAELLDKAPASTSIFKRTDMATNSIPRYYVETFEHYRDSDWNENPAEALGLMLEYLITNNLMTV